MSRSNLAGREEASVAIPHADAVWASSLWGLTAAHPPRPGSGAERVGVSTCLSDPSRPLAMGTGNQVGFQIPSCFLRDPGLRCLLHVPGGGATREAGAIERGSCLSAPYNVAPRTFDFQREAENLEISTLAMNSKFNETIPQREQGYVSLGRGWGCGVPSSSRGAPRHGSGHERMLKLELGIYKGSGVRGTQAALSGK